MIKLVRLIDKSRKISKFLFVKFLMYGDEFSLCSRIVADHDGLLELTDRQWIGAEFRIKLPIKN